MLNKHRLLQSLQAFLLLIFMAPQVAWGIDAYPVVFEAKQKAIISAERDGLIKKLDVDTGDAVKKGELLVSLEHQNLILERLRYRHQNNYDRKRVDNLAKLFDKGIVSDDELAQSVRDKNLSETDIKLVNDRILHSEVKAPYDAKIIKRHYQPFEWVAVGQPILEILNPNALKATGHLPTGIAKNFKVGQANKFYIKDIGEDSEGKIIALSPAVDVKSNTIKVVWEITKRPDSLLAGMKGTIRLGHQDEQQPKKIQPIAPQSN